MQRWRADLANASLVQPVTMPGHSYMYILGTWEQSEPDEPWREWYYYQSPEQTFEGVDKSVQGGVDKSLQGGVDKNVHQEDIKGRLKKEDYPGSEDSDIEYVPVSDDGTEVGGDGRPALPKWAVAETEFQREVLEICNASKFKSREKSAVKWLNQCLQAGEVWHDPVSLYEHVCETMRGREEVPTAPFPMPRTWFGYKADHARKHRWSVGGFLKALKNRDKLVAHCVYMLRELNKIDEPAFTAVDGELEEVQNPDEWFEKYQQRLGRDGGEQRPAA